VTLFLTIKWMRLMTVNAYYLKLGAQANRPDETINEVAQRSVLAPINQLANLSWMFGSICIIIEG
jgi:hypothetical protein